MCFQVLRVKVRVSSLLKQFSMLFQFSSFQYFTSLTQRVYPHTRDNNVVLAVSHFACGCLSGAIANCFSQPVDVLRTRLAAQKEPMVCFSFIAEVPKCAKLQQRCCG